MGTRRGHGGVGRLLVGGPLTLALLATLHAGAALKAQTPLSGAAADSASLSVVRAYFTAYNAHDVEAVLRLVAPDFVWLSLAGDSVVVEARGAEAIRTGLVDYLRRLPSARSDIEAISALGPWVSVRERARWEGANGPRSQAGLSVYEIRDGLLRRVWYYPVVRE
ncbi:MAG: nuclear transport factor 2 family protein [Gemmatimonadales bacterium]